MQIISGNRKAPKSSALNKLLFNMLYLDLADCVIVAKKHGLANFCSVYCSNRVENCLLRENIFSLPWVGLFGTN